MKNNKISVVLIFTGAFLFNIIFWNEQLAVNTVLFDAFILGSLFFLYNDAYKNITVRYLLLAHLASLAAVILFNSQLSKISFFSTLFLLTAFTEYRHRSVWYAAGSILLSFTSFLKNFFSLLRNNKNDRQNNKPFKRYIRFAILPLTAVVFFFVIYSNANTVFAGIAGRIGTGIEKFFSGFFDLFSFNRLVFLLFGFYFTGALLLRTSYTRFEKRETFALNNMLRIRKRRMDKNRNLFYSFTVDIMGKLAKGALALKNEYKTGVISLILLNLLLLVINVIDIDYLWIHFTYTPAVDLFTMIHEGTELLIFSIVMAMFVVLIFFRGNLNFYKKNKWLKAGAYIWLLQNIMLVASVLLRDYYYIREFGLAYKRIGVLVFLLLVIAGLFTVFLKVHYAKTNYYLLRVNAWCVVALLVAGSAIQWDVLIARYNIAHRKSAPLNLPYLLTLSDKVLPVLDANIGILKEREKELNEKDISLGRCTGCIEQIISDRRKQYMEEQQKYSWLSWNMNDAEEQRYFSRKTATIAMEK